MRLTSHLDALTWCPHLAAGRAMAFDHGANLKPFQAAVGQQFASTGGGHVLALTGTVHDHLRPEDPALGQRLVLDDRTQVRPRRIEAVVVILTVLSKDSDLAVPIGDGAPN
ncbi:hypothetical protein D3C76_1626110 [compost metagenome]